jgi:DNA-binding NtrC family response regulator
VIEPEHFGLASLAALRASLPPGHAVSDQGSGSREGSANGAEGAVTIPLGLSLDKVEQKYIEATLRANGGNVTRAAQSLGVGRNTLRRKRGGV